MCIKKKMTTLVLLPWQQFCHWCWVNKNRNSRFCFKTRTIYPTQSNDGTKDNIGNISVRSRTLCTTVEVANGDFFCFFTKRDWGKKICYVDISKTKKDISKRKTPFFCMLKDLQISTNYFSLHRHFKGHKQQSSVLAKHYKNALGTIPQDLLKRFKVRLGYTWRLFWSLTRPSAN